MILWVRAVGCHGKPRDALPEDSTFVGRCGILALCCGCSYPGLTNSGPPHSPAVAIVYPKVPSSSGAYVYVPGKIRLPHTWRKNPSRFNKSVEEFLLQKAVFFYLQTNPFFFMSGDRMRIANTASQEITFKCSPIWFRVSFMYREQLSTQLLLTQKSPKERTKGRGIKMKFAVLWLQKSKFSFQIIFLIQFYWKKGMALINIFRFVNKGRLIVQECPGFTNQIFQPAAQVSWGRGYFKLRKLTELHCEKAHSLLGAARYFMCHCVLLQWPFCVHLRSSGKGLSFCCMLLQCSLVLSGTCRTYHSIDHVSCNW